MDVKRRIECNKIRDQIRRVQSHINVDEATLTRFYDQNTNITFYQAQIAKIKVKISDKKTELENLETRYSYVEDGLADEELMTEYIKTTKEVNKKAELTRKKKKQEQTEKKTGNDKSKEYHKAIYRADRPYKSEKEMVYAYERFVKACNSIPDYILKKLKYMPRNKGYIWKDIHCYGELPARNGESCIMIERRRDGMLILHETTETEYKIWHKKDRGRKVLISTKPRREKAEISGTLMDYVKL